MNDEVVRKLVFEDGSWCWEIGTDTTAVWVSDEFMEKLLKHQRVAEEAEKQEDNK